MIIQVVGTGCKSCKKLLKNVEAAKKALNMDIDIKYVTEMEAIMETGVVHTPGLVVDGKIVSSGQVLSQDDIIKIIKTN
jgi:small redox-active disulfide protein 2